MTFFVFFYVFICSLGCALSIFYAKSDGNVPPILKVRLEPPVQGLKKVVSFKTYCPVFPPCHVSASANTENDPWLSLFDIGKEVVSIRILQLFQLLDDNCRIHNIKAIKSNL